MNNALDENAKLDVNISHLLATEVELEKLKELILKGLGINTTLPKVSCEDSNIKGDFYEVNFTIIKPKSYHKEMIREWLYSLSLVEWQINATYVA
ncbi:MAG: hypothetical protein ACI9VT_003592 [Psychroserpens sp.]|jgi:hypothetical protein